MLRPGNAGSNTAADHITATRAALAQIPAAARRRVLIRADSGGGTHGFLEWLARRRLQYSAGFTITDDMQPAIMRLPAAAWTPAYDGAGRVRDGAWVAELTGLLNLSSWPEGMRVIVRKERPHPGAQLRFTDVGGHRFTAFATSARTGQLADLELRHRRRARCEDRIRCAKDTGLRCLPLHGYDQNQIWCQIVALACELLAWTAMLALTGPARRWEPKRLRLRLLSAAGRIVRGSRRLRLRLAARWPWVTQITDAITPAASTRTRLTQTPHPCSSEGETKGRGTPPTRHGSRAASHSRQSETMTRPPPHATDRRSRKIEVSARRYAPTGSGLARKAAIDIGPAEAYAKADHNALRGPRPSDHKQRSRLRTLDGSASSLQDAHDFILGFE
jgi:hypothetical protein